MKATSSTHEYIYKRFIMTMLMVIITLPGTHLLANDDTPVARYKTSAHHHQLEKAIDETKNRIQNYFFKTSENTTRGFSDLQTMEIFIELLPSSTMNYQLSGFIPASAGKSPTILINRNWLEYGISDEALIRVILEGTGAAIAIKKDDKPLADGNWLANELSSIYRDEISFSKKADAILLNGIRTEVYFQ